MIDQLLFSPTYPQALRSPCPGLQMSHTVRFPRRSTACACTPARSQHRAPATVDRCTRRRPGPHSRLARPRRPPPRQIRHVRRHLSSRTHRCQRRGGRPVIRRLRAVQLQPRAAEAQTARTAHPGVCFAIAQTESLAGCWESVRMVCLGATPQRPGEGRSRAQGLRYRSHAGGIRWS